MALNNAQLATGHNPQNTVLHDTFIKYSPEMCAHMEQTIYLKVSGTYICSYQLSARIPFPQYTVIRTQLYNFQYHSALNVCCLYSKILQLLHVILQICMWYMHAYVHFSHIASQLIMPDFNVMQYLPSYQLFKLLKFHIPTDEHNFEPNRLDFGALFKSIIQADLKHNRLIATTLA